MRDGWGMFRCWFFFVNCTAYRLWPLRERVRMIKWKEAGHVFARAQTCRTGPLLPGALCAWLWYSPCLHLWMLFQRLTETPNSISCSSCHTEHRKITLLTGAEIRRSIRIQYESNRAHSALTEGEKLFSDSGLIGAGWTSLTGCLTLKVLLCAFLY